MNQLPQKGKSNQNYGSYWVSYRGTMRPKTLYIIYSICNLYIIVVWYVVVLLNRLVKHSILSHSLSYPFLSTSTHRYSLCLPILSLSFSLSVSLLFSLSLSLSLFLLLSLFYLSSSMIVSFRRKYSKIL